MNTVVILIDVCLIDVSFIKNFYCDPNAVIDQALVSKQRTQYYDKHSLFYKENRYISKDTHDPSKRVAGDVVKPNPDVLESVRR